jgi:phospholipid/cholesterol/gamma-HCH transport system ATP-binding protein
MRKRAAMARAIALDPDILFCDEPNAGLDPVTSAGIDRLILDLREALGITVVVISHELRSIRRLADQVTMLHAGVVVADGKLEELGASQDPRIRSFFQGGSEEEEDEAGGILRQLFVD